MATSFEKWPVEIQVVKVSSNSLNPDLDTFFVSGVMNLEQVATLEVRLKVLAKFRVDDDRVVASTVVSRQQMIGALEACRTLAKSWRGQYQVVMKAFVQAGDEAIKG